MTDPLVVSPRVYFNDGGQAANGSAGVPGVGNGYQDIGHLPQLELTPERETLDYHRVSNSGERIKVMSLVISQALGMTMTFDEINAETVNLLLSGDGTTSNVQAGDTIVQESHNVPILLDRSFFLSEVQASSIIITGTGSVGTYTLDTDYNVIANADNNEIKVLSPPGTITSGQLVKVNYESAAKTRDTINPLKDSLVQGSARIEMRTVGSALSGPAWTWIIENAILRSEGGITFGGEVAQPTLFLDVLADTVVYPANPHGVVNVG